MESTIVCKSISSSEKGTCCRLCKYALAISIASGFLKILCIPNNPETKNVSNIKILFRFLIGIDQIFVIDPIL